MGTSVWMTGWGQVSGEWDEKQNIMMQIEDAPKQQLPEMDKWKKKERNSFDKFRNVARNIFINLCYTEVTYTN